MHTSTQENQVAAYWVAHNVNLQGFGGAGQAFEHMTQPGVGLLAVDLGGFDQAVDLRARCGAFQGVAVLAADDEGPGVLGAVVVDRQVAAFDVAHQLVPVAGQVVDRLAQGGLPGDLRLGLVQPGLELVEDRHAALLTGTQAFAVVSLFQVTLDAVELVDQVQRHVGAPGLALGLHLLRLDELAPRVGPAAQTLDASLEGHGVVAGVVVGHQVAAIAVEQAQRHVLRAAGAVVEEDHQPARWSAASHPHPGLRDGIATRFVQHL